MNAVNTFFGALLFAYIGIGFAYTFVARFNAFVVFTFERFSTRKTAAKGLLATWDDFTLFVHSVAVFCGEHHARWTCLSCGFEERQRYDNLLKDITICSLFYLSGGFYLSGSCAIRDDHKDDVGNRVYHTLGASCHTGLVGKLLGHHTHSIIHRMNFDSMASNDLYE